MKKIVLLMIISINIFGHSNLIVFAASPKFELKTDKANLRIDKEGNIKIIDNDKIVQINLPADKLWQIVLKNIQDGKEYVFAADNNFTIDKSDHLIRLVPNHFYIGDKSMPVNAEFTISVKNDAFCFSGTLSVESDEWILKELKYPNINGIRCKKDKVAVCWPEGLGQYFEDPNDFGTRSLEYPSAKGAAMPWYSLNSQDRSVYFGCHDPLQGEKTLHLSYDEFSNSFYTTFNLPIYDNEYSIPEIMVKPYSGQWYEAAKFYRTWYDKHFKVATPPDWVKDDAGCLLAILKQQNMEVMWTYYEIDKLCDIAEQFNLSTIGLFGWAVGGHDHLYPNYPPDNLMGGRKKLEKAIERAHERGIKIIVYANGVLIDTSTDFYLYNGYETMLMQENKKPLIRYFIKQKIATPVIFAQACTGSWAWRQTMYGLGRQALNLGADGILYDQLGVLPPSLCFSENHEHKPGKSDAKYRLEMIKSISEDMGKINPDFIVMTEATNDLVLRGIVYTHGWGKGTAPQQNVFPELYRYTFPELVTTQRNPNPMITRTDANFAVIYGLRHEIESRYPGDVEYLLHGTLPTVEDYSNVVSRPDLNKMNFLSKDEATQYVHDLIAFENDHSDFFRRGKFIDEEGIKVQGDDIVAKGFMSGNRIGVVVWNQHLSEKKNFSVSVEGYRLINSFDPYDPKVDNATPLKANSIRLLIFKKGN